MSSKKKKYVNVKPFLTKYPKPEPPNKKRSDCFKEDNSTNAIAYDALKVSIDIDTTFPSLVDSLTSHLNGEVVKTWAMFNWVGAQLTQEENNASSPEEGTPLWYTVRLKRGQSKDFASLIAILLRVADIPCVIISGKGKGSDYCVGDEDVKGESFWNAVYVEADWFLLHPHWAFQSIIGYQAKNWVKVEEDGNQMAQQDHPSSGDILSDQNAFYFLTDPEQFKYFCRPHDDQSAWQLLQVPMSTKAFLDQPLLTPEFLTSSAGFRFVRGQSNTIKSDHGESQLVIVAENRRWNGQLTYSLFYRGHSGQSFPADTSADNYVILCNRNSQNEIKFVIRFPIAGVYRLMVVDKLKSMWLCDLKFLCGEPRVNCNPLPLNPRIGWGPGETAKRKGITNVSHTEGIISSNKEDKLEISFETKSDTKIKASLKHVKKSNQELQKYIHKKENHSTVTIRVDLPDNDEYAVVIDAKLASEMFENALNYLVTAPNKNNYHQSPPYVNPTVKRITDDLESSIHSQSGDKLLSAIEKYNRLGLPDSDSNILTRANDRLKGLRIKDNLKHAILAARKDKLEAAIKDAKHAQDIINLSQLIAKAQQTLYDLKRSPLDAKSMTTRYRNQNTPR